MQDSSFLNETSFFEKISEIISYEDSIGIFSAVNFDLAGKYS